VTFLTVDQSFNCAKVRSNPTPLGAIDAGRIDADTEGRAVGYLYDALFTLQLGAAAIYGIAA